METSNSPGDELPASERVKKFVVTIKRSDGKDPVFRWYWRVNHGYTHRSGMAMSEARAHKAVQKCIANWKLDDYKRESATMFIVD